MNTMLFLSQARLGHFFKQNILILTLLCIGTILFAYGLYLSILPKDDGIVIEQAHSEEKMVETVFIDVEGAVNTPGVYELEAHLRIQDALIAAGGLSADADREQISQTINLAKKLSDGIKVYFPFVGEKASLTTTSGEQVAGSQSSLVDINSASEAELDALSGIGPVTANKIISGRPYSSVEELETKKILNAKTYAALKDQLTAN